MEQKQHNCAVSISPQSHYKVKSVHTNHCRKKRHLPLLPKPETQWCTLKTSRYLTGWNNNAGNPTSHFFSICSVKDDTATLLSQWYISKVLLIQKLHGQVSPLIGFTAAMRNVKHCTLFASWVKAWTLYKLTLPFSITDAIYRPLGLIAAVLIPSSWLPMAKSSLHVSILINLIILSWLNTPRTCKLKGSISNAVNVNQRGIPKEYQIKDWPSIKL